jgi:hypothetical protein
MRDILSYSDFASETDVSLFNLGTPISSYRMVEKKNSLLFPDIYLHDHTDIVGYTVNVDASSCVSGLHFQAYLNAPHIGKKLTFKASLVASVCLNLIS